MTFNSKTWFGKNAFLFFALSSSVLWFNNLIAQQITGISASGAVVVSTGNTYAITWTATAGANASYKSIDISFTGVGGNTEVWFKDTSSQTTWQLQYGSVQSAAWKDFCPSSSAMAWKPNSNLTQGAGTATVYIRNSNTTTGVYSNLITFGFGTDCNSITTAITIQATVNIVDANSGIYTWSEPPTGVDSSYKIAANWTPTRTTPKSSDVLVVDLAQGSTRNTTIYMDGVNDSISQFIIYPYNNVTFKCSTSSNSGNWYVGPKTNQLSDNEFRLDSLAGMIYNGGTLNLNLLNNNQALFKSNLTVYSGTLNFNGQGTHTFHKDIAIPGGTLKFHPATGTNTLYLKGTNTKLTGSGGTLYIDSLMNVVIGNGANSTYTLERTLPIISNLTLRANTTVASNSPANYTTSSTVNAFNPHLQLKATPKANSTAHGQVTEIPSTSSITGGVLFEIFNNKQRAYRALGLPLSNGVIIPQFTDNIDVTGNVSGNNANEFTTSCSWCTHSIFSWNETTSGWSPYASANSVTNIPHGSGTLIFFRGAKGNGLGDTTVVANEQVLDFKGNLAQGSYNFSLVNNGTGSLKGYNLIGNPYPCTVDLRNVYESNKNTLLPRFYLYDAVSRKYNTWDSVGKNGNASTRQGTTKFENGASRNTSKLLAAGGAVFFILDPNGSSSTLTFNENHKFVGAHSSTKHFSSGVQEETSSECNELKSELRFQNNVQPESDGFTMEFDRAGMSQDGDVYDATKMWAYLAYGPVTANNSWLSIDRRDKIANPGESKSIPLKVVYPKDAPTAMEISFNYCASGNYRYDVKLIDKFNQTSTPVTEGTTYTFNASNTDEKKSDRFELVFTGKTISNTADLESKKPIIYPNPTDGQIQIIGNGQQINKIEIFSNFGQLLLSENIKPLSDVISVSISKLPTGIYIIKTHTTLGSHSQLVNRQ
jgi:hypothetical protein